MSTTRRTFLNAGALHEAERWLNGREAPRQPVNARRWDQEMFGMSYRTSANTQLSSYGTRQKGCAKKAAAVEPRLIDVLYPSRTLRPYCVSRLSTSSLPGIAGMPPGRSTQQEAAAQAKDPA